MSHELRLLTDTRWYCSCGDTSRKHPDRDAAAAAFEKHVESFSPKA